MNSLNLKDFQRHFKDAIYTSDVHMLHSYISASSVRPEQLIEVYRNNIFTNLHAALNETYSLLKKVVGDDFFKTVCHFYIRDHPSMSGDVERYGESFDIFLERFEHSKSMPYLADIARYEWKLHESYFAENHVPITLNDLQNYQTTPIDELQFTLHPSVHFFTSSYAIDTLIAASESDFAEEASPIDIHSHQCYGIISRPYFKVITTWVEKDIFEVIKLFDQGNRLSAALEILDETRMTTLLDTLVTIGVSAKIN